MKFIATIAQAGQPAPGPSSVPSPPGAATEWAILLAAIAWLGRQAWALFESKEQRESQLTAGLIDDLRKERSELISNAKTGFKDVTQAIAELRTTLHDGQLDIDRDFQELKRDQAGEYAGLMLAIGKLQQSIDAVHFRFDDLLGSQRQARQPGGPDEG